ncbi:hypothetical protein [Exiguobacterium mexicanum]
MAIFQYEGKLLNGKRKKGRVTAVSLREAKESCAKNRFSSPSSRNSSRRD